MFKHWLVEHCTSTILCPWKTISLKNGTAMESKMAPSYAYINC